MSRKKISHEEIAPTYRNARIQFVKFNQSSFPKDIGLQYLIQPNKNIQV